MFRTTRSQVLVLGIFLAAWVALILLAHPWDVFLPFADECRGAPGCL